MVKALGNVTNGEKCSPRIAAKQLPVLVFPTGIDLNTVYDYTFCLDLNRRNQDFKEYDVEV